MPTSDLRQAVDLLIGLIHELLEDEDWIVDPEPMWADPETRPDGSTGWSYRPRGPDVCGEVFVVLVDEIPSGEPGDGPWYQATWAHPDLGEVELAIHSESGDLELRVEPWS